MKKLIALLLTLITLLSLAACGDDAGSNTVYDADDLAELLREEDYYVSVTDGEDYFEDFCDTLEDDYDVNVDDLEEPTDMITADDLRVFIFKTPEQARALKRAVDDAMNADREELEKKASKKDMNLDEYLEDKYDVDNWDEYVEEKYGFIECEGNVYYSTKSKRTNKDMIQILEDAIELAAEKAEDASNEYSVKEIKNNLKDEDYDVEVVDDDDLEDMEEYFDEYDAPYPTDALRAENFDDEAIIQIYFFESNDDAEEFCDAMQGTTGEAFKTKGNCAYFGDKKAVKAAFGK